jgi:hypothetical protein
MCGYRPVRVTAVEPGLKAIEEGSYPVFLMVGIVVQHRTTARLSEG